jgi:DNA-binding XRE family transcriptional regulator
MRRAMHPHLTPASLPSYTAAQLRGVRYLLDRLLSDPEHFRQHSRAYVGHLPPPYEAITNCAQVLRPDRLRDGLRTSRWGEDCDLHEGCRRVYAYDGRVCEPRASLPFGGYPCSCVRVPSDARLTIRNHETVKYLPVWKTAFRIKKILQHVLDEPYATLKSKLVRLLRLSLQDSLTLYQDKGSQEQPVGALLLNEAGSAHDLNDIEIRDLCGIFYVGK